MDCLTALAMTVKVHLTASVCNEVIDGVMLLFDLIGIPLMACILANSAL